MRRHYPVLLLTLSLLSVNVAAAAIGDAATAINAAKAALQAKYGSTFNEFRPRRNLGDDRRFYASRRGHTWVVEDAPPNRRQWVNPVLRVKLDASSGAVMSIVDTGE